MNGPWQSYVPSCTQLVYITDKYICKWTKFVSLDKKKTHQVFSALIWKTLRMLYREHG